VIFVGRKAKDKGLNDPIVSALLTEAQDSIVHFARPSWLLHSPHLVDGIKDTLLAIANMETNADQSQDAPDPLTSQLPVSHSPLALESPTFGNDSNDDIVRVY
jgi:hypothetical protein